MTNGYTLGMKTAISLPDNLFKEAEATAKDLGLSRSRLIQTALEEFLQRRRDEALTAEINRHIEKYGDPSDDDEGEAWLAHNREMLRRVEWKE
jgi:metal-responsive CopG/Arc/MetJ family transcriptional regulator